MSRAIVLSSVLGLAVLAAAAQSAPVAPPPSGQQLYAQRCAACHGADGQGGAIGPALRGVAGRVAGRVPGYAYSPALKSANLKLDRAGLDSFLMAPAKRVPGTKMPIGVPAAADRAAIIHHLETLK